MIIDTINLLKNIFDSEELNIDSLHRLLLEKIIITPISKRPGEQKLKCKNNPDLSFDIITYYNENQKTKTYLNKNIDFLNELDDEEIKYFCYLVTNEGFRFGRVYDVMEWGASHMMLPEIDELCWFGGEIKITKSKVEYNFESGTYNIPLKLPRRSENENTMETDFDLYVILKYIMESYFKRNTTELEIEFTDDILFEKKSANLRTLLQICNTNRITITGPGERCQKNSLNAMSKRLNNNSGTLLKEKHERGNNDCKKVILDMINKKFN